LGKEDGMINEELKSLTCPYCASTGAGIRYDFNECAIVRCHFCNLMWLHPTPSLDQLAEVYASEYFANKEFLKGNKETHIWGYTDYIAERINKQYQYQKLVRNAKNMLLENNGAARNSKLSWLDVGCGLGYLLDVAFDEGFAVSGIEFNKSAVEYIRSKYVYDVRHGDILKADFQKNFDVISAIDVIEHLHDPFGFIRKLRQTIEPNGLLIIGTMDSDSPISRLFGKRLEDFRRIREHLFFFSRKTLSAILESNGFEVLHIEYVGHTFQIHALLGRINLMIPGLGNLIKALIRPTWLLDANFYINPRTKILVFARPKRF
jgi:2-polyprenyl-3-methyl-5-hydroxy-6-metoxy-1,4-benzoquinol methylase